MIVQRIQPLKQTAQLLVLGNNDPRTPEAHEVGIRDRRPDLDTAFFPLPYSAHAESHRTTFRNRSPNLSLECEVPRGTIEADITAFRRVDPAGRYLTVSAVVCAPLWSTLRHLLE